MKKPMKKILSLVLSVLLLIPHFNLALAEETGNSNEGSSGSSPATFVTEVDPSSINVPRGLPVEESGDPDSQKRASSEPVRVSIVIEGKSALEKGYSFKNIGTNKKANEYRKSLEKKQEAIAKKISEKVLGGQKLDVVTSFTLAANIISAYVPENLIDEIKKIDGVVDVFRENRYYPDVSLYSDGDAPNMVTSREMTNSNGTYSSLYNGAGSKIAIIDTGLDVEHISFNEDAFLHAIEEDGAMDKLMTQADWSGLNLHALTPVYISAKIPFAYNYIDENTNIGHMQDTGSEHGSHVAGIATANRYIKQGEEFVDAAETVGVVGQAPDAQILVMKVFGVGGGAYDSDYFDAVEDAILLGCDAANLSLGGKNPGFSFTNNYLNILDRLKDTGFVMVTSGGNNYYWDYKKQLYYDDINFQTGGSPGSFRQTLSVASINTSGDVLPFIKFNDSLELRYTEGGSANNAPMTSIAGTYEYIYIDSFGTEEEFRALRDLVDGKVALCNRGSTSFFEKANAAVSNGAVATIVVNNDRGIIAMNLSGYISTKPAVSIKRSEGAKIKDQSTRGERDGIVYYTGTIEIGGEDNMTTSAFYEMSSFSAWGVPGSLLLKPEITAPGGDVYSVNGLHKPVDNEDSGGGHDAYELMSGTSMAAPQITGIMAVIGQYYRENNIGEKTRLSLRQFALSTLMATAVPVFEEESGNYYSVMKQGAGLVSVDDAVHAKGFIKMSEEDGTLTALSGAAADYRVKAELGDDPDRTGEFKFTFTFTNFSEETIKYLLSTDLFTQDFDKAEPVDRLSQLTKSVKGDVTYVITLEEISHDVNKDGETNYDDVRAILDYTTGKVDGAELDLEAGKMDEDDEVTTRDAYLLLEFLEKEVGVGPDWFILEGGLTAKVEVTIKVTDSELLERVNGGYLEGFTYVESTDDVVYSIPVLGYCGSWTDPSMFDAVSMENSQYPNGKQSYWDSTTPNGVSIKYPAGTTNYWITGNPYLVEDEFPADRLAINSSTTLVQVRYNLIRNAANTFLAAVDSENNVLTSSTVGSNVIAAYYYTQQATPAWQNTQAKTASINKTPAQLGVSENEQFTIGLYALPEYYGLVASEGSTGNISLTDFNSLVKSGVLGRGAYVGYTMTVDDTRPEILGVEYKDENTIVVRVKDNQYVAYLALMNPSGTVTYAEVVPEQSAAGEEIIQEFDVTGMNIGAGVLVFAADYAKNEFAGIYQVGEGDIIVEKVHYELTNTVTPGKKYLIVQRNNAGTGYAFGHNDANRVRDEVKVNAADANIAVPYINSDDVDSTSVWSVSEGLKFENGGYYIAVPRTSLQVQTDDSANAWTWDGTNNRLSIANAQGSTTYFRYSNNSFTVSTTAGSIYMYVEVVVQEVFNPDKVEKVTVTPATASIYLGTSTSFLAEVLPLTLDDRSVTWSTSDESIATVDANGVVTGVAAGTVEVIATSNKDNTTFGTATLTVMDRTVLDATINAQITDESGSNFVRINLSDLTYSMLGSSAGQHYGGGRSDNTIIGYMSNGNIIETIIDGDSYSSAILGSFGTTTYNSRDGAHIPVLVAFDENGEPLLVEQYNSIYVASRYLLLFDANSGGITGWGLSGYSALAYIGTDPETFEHYYFALNGSGQLVQLVIGVDEEEPITVDPEDGTSSLTLTLGYSDPMTIDGLTFGANYMSMTVLATDEYFGLLVANTNTKTMYFIDLTAESFKAELVGGWANITAINTLYDDFMDANIIALESVNGADRIIEEFKANATTKVKAEKLGNINDFAVEKAEEAEGDGTLNALVNNAEARVNEKKYISDAELQSASGSSETAEDGTVTVEIKESDLTSNGLYVVEYDADALEYVSTESDFTYSSVYDAEEGIIRFAFADLEGAEADSVIATVTFKIGCLDNEIAVKTLENNEELDLEETETIEVEGTDHKWGEPTYEWAEDNSTVTATRVCENDPSHKETETVSVTSETVAPTCEEAGKIIYTSAEFENEAFKKQTKEVEDKPATGHDWDEPVYTWADDNSTVTAVRVCKNNALHVETETVKTTKTVVDPTCEEAGTITYEAVFENEAFKKQTKEVAGEPATGHKWGEPTYEWSEDNSTVTATRVCENDPEHVETETAKTTKTVVEPTNSEDGKIIYTAEFENEGFEKQVKELAGDPAIIVYTISEGADGKWTKGSGEDFLIVVNRSKDDNTTFSHFKGIEVDGSEIDPSAYTAEAGSLKASLSSEYLETLSEGEHKVKVVFDDGEVLTSLTINPEGTPGTGDRSMITLYAVLMAVSLSSAAGAVIYLKRKED